MLHPIFLLYNNPETQTEDRLVRDLDLSYSTLLTAQYVTRPTAFVDLVEVLNTERIRPEDTSVLMGSASEDRLQGVVMKGYQTPQYDLESSIENMSDGSLLGRRCDNPPDSLEPSASRRRNIRTKVLAVSTLPHFLIIQFRRKMRRTFCLLIIGYLAVRSVTLSSCCIQTRL